MDGEGLNNTSFTDLRNFLNHLGFQHRTKGSHFIYFHPGHNEFIITIQPNGNKAKAYQLKQIRFILNKYNL